MKEYSNIFSQFSLSSRSLSARPSFYAFFMRELSKTFILFLPQCCCCCCYWCCCCCRCSCWCRSGRIIIMIIWVLTHPFHISLCGYTALLSHSCHICRVCSFQPVHHKLKKLFRIRFDLNIRVNLQYFIQSVVRSEPK